MRVDSEIAFPETFTLDCQRSKFVELGRGLSIEYDALLSSQTGCACIVNDCDKGEPNDVETSIGELGALPPDIE